MRREDRECWRITDSRTDRPVSIACYPSERRARQEIEYYRDRDAKGGRPDIRDLMPYLDTRPVRPGDW